MPMDILIPRVTWRHSLRMRDARVGSIGAKWASFMQLTFASFFSVGFI